MDRGEGTTTGQMQNSPKGAVFVWVNHHLDYPRQLARKLKRDDLKIVSPEWLSDPMRWAGLELSALVLDHAAHLSPRQWDGWNHALSRVRAPETVGAVHRE